MTTPDAQVEPRIGFLTVLDDPAAGYLGGYLVVDRRGRPLEFHCTAPIVPSRAEEILFGATLRPHLFAERIGAALLTKAVAGVTLVVINQVDSWTIADETTVPVVMVEAGDDVGIGPPQPRLDRIDPALRPAVERQLEELTRYVELAEPFERIAEAIREATAPATSTQDETSAHEVPRDQAA